VLRRPIETAALIWHVDYFLTGDSGALVSQNKRLARLFSRECIVSRLQLAALEMRGLRGTVSDLLFEFFATDLHFLFYDGADDSSRERDPFFFELFYALLPVAATTSLRHSFASVPWSLLIAAAAFISGNQNFHESKVTSKCA